MAPGKNQQATKSQSHYLLRVIATSSAALGVFLNIIAISVVTNIRGWHDAEVLLGWVFLPLLGSLIWDFFHLLADKITTVHPSLQGCGDALAFLGFLAILIANGVVANHMGRYWTSVDKIMLLAYNSFPWVICAAMHICLALSSFFPAIDFSKHPRIRIEWVGEPRHHLVANPSDQYGDDEDVEAQHTKKASTDGENEEEEPLLNSS